MANFCCSIETEPRTLNQGQLNYAREIAVDIVHNKDTDEASSIFNEGLNPVIGSIKETVVVVVSDANPPHSAVEECTQKDVKGQNNLETNCQCSSSALALMGSPPEECRVKSPFLPLFEA